MVLSAWQKSSETQYAKSQDGIFIGPQICEIINVGLSEYLLIESEKSS